MALRIAHARKIGRNIAARIRVRSFAPSHGGTSPARGKPRFNRASGRARAQLFDLGIVHDGPSISSGRLERVASVRIDTLMMSPMPA
jgi:hypothetical protein